MISCIPREVVLNGPDILIDVVNTSCIVRANAETKAATTHGLSTCSRIVNTTTGNIGTGGIISYLSGVTHKVSANTELIVHILADG